MRVSDECLGRMLADRYTMCKEAGLLDTLGKGTKAVGGMLGRSAVATGEHLATNIVPLLISSGILALAGLSKMREEGKQEAEANRIFTDIKTNNSFVKEHPVTAEHAFNTLKSLAPSLASNPLVTKTFIEHVINSDGRLPPETVIMLADAQSKINRSQDLPKLEQRGGMLGFVQGLKGPMGAFTSGLELPHHSEQKSHGSFSPSSSTPPGKYNMSTLRYEPETPPRRDPSTGALIE